MEARRVIKQDACRPPLATDGNSQLTTSASDCQSVTIVKPPEVGIASGGA